MARLIGARLAQGQRLRGETSLGDHLHAVTHGTVRAVGDVVTTPLRLAEPPAPASQAAVD